VISSLLVTFCYFYLFAVLNSVLYDDTNIMLISTYNAYYDLMEIIDVLGQM